MHGQSVSCREVLVETYSSQVGVREEGGNNKGKQVSEYLAVTGFSDPVAWCAAFVAWCHDRTGVYTVQSAWSPAWFPESRTIYSRTDKFSLTPRAGDVFGIYYNSKKRIAHVGFIDAWNPDDDYCITVEGNTNGDGSREGDGVYRKRRLKRQIYKVSRWVLD
ncbi:CHAP domain-containing protein [Limibacter armeniacum]|uniref:CHAP domain-containing protein n=1 Tax=Limibacter armeniacum TaxID=466084 RepID=UPI002FE5F8CF